jgi:hypothetical protein
MGYIPIAKDWVKKTAVITRYLAEGKIRCPEGS